MTATALKTASKTTKAAKASPKTVKASAPKKPAAKKAAPKAKSEPAAEEAPAEPEQTTPAPEVEAAQVLAPQVDHEEPTEADALAELRTVVTEQRSKLLSALCALETAAKDAVNTMATDGTPSSDFIKAADAATDALHRLKALDLVLRQSGVDKLLAGATPRAPRAHQPRPDGLSVRESRVLNIVQRATKTGARNLPAISLERWPWQVGYRYDDRGNPFAAIAYGRFGGCWTWKLGLAYSHGTLVLDLVLGSVVLRWGRK